MESELPDWLNESFLASVLQGEDEPPVSVVEFSAKAAVAPGTNYLSHLLRVYVQYKVGETTVQSISLIIKIPIVKGCVNDMTGNIDEFFANEPHMYTKVLPKMEETLNVELGPKSFQCPVKNGLILEDLNNKGYTMFEKYKQLDYHYCQSAVIKIAKFHAASVSCVHNNPELIKVVGDEGFYTGDSHCKNVMEPWITNCVKIIGTIVKGLEGCEKLSELLLGRVDSISQSAVNLCKPKVSGLNVLNHGDLWINNMLFKHNELGEVVDVKFIDYQTTKYTSPVQDLLYFVWTSADEAVREARQPELYELYRQTLNSTLEELGCEERFSAEELQEDLKTYSDWAIVAFCGTLPFAVCEASEVVNMEDIEGEDVKSGKSDEVFSKAYHSKKFKALLPNLVKHFDAWISSIN